MQNKNAWSLSLMTSLLVSVITCLLMPFSMYDSNPFEFSRTAYFEVLFCSGMLAIVVAMMVFVVALVVQRLWPRVYLLFVGLMVGLCVALYAQGNLIGADYGALDGHVIQWDAMRVTAVLNTLLWCACLLVPVIGAIFWPRYAEWGFRRCVPIFLAYVSLLVIMLAVTNVSAFGRKQPMRLSLDRFMELSSERNLVVIVLDAFDRGMFDKLLSDDPTWRSRLVGFTYYHNTVSAFCYTDYALPQIVSGCVQPEGGLTVWDYQRKAYSDAPFLREAKDLGYKIEAYFDDAEAPVADDFSWMATYDNVIENANKHVSLDNLKYYWPLLFCSTFRYLPHELKKCWFLVNDCLKGTVCGISEEVEQLLSSRLDSGSFSLVKNKKVKIYHCFSVHIPIFNIEKAKESLELVCRFAAKVREAGIYDKTDFFIMADHGSINRCRPLFMCSNGTDEFKVSEMPFSYRHLCEAFSDSLNGRPIRPVEASAKEMVPIIDDPERVKISYIDGKFFDGIGTEFFGTGLELLATTAEMDVVVTNGSSRMIWDGTDAIIGVPVEKCLRDCELSLTLTFDQVISNGLNLAVQYGFNNPQSMDCCYRVGQNGKTTDVVVKLLDMSKNPDKRFVKLHFHKWEWTLPAPSIVKVKISPCGEVP